MILPKIFGFNERSDTGNSIFAPCIFLPNCNLRCPYCMNSKLVLNKAEKEINIETIKDYVIKNNVNMLNISGGEPTLHDNLINLIDEIKSWGCNVGISTNGTTYFLRDVDFMEEIINKVNYVSLDIKTTFKKFKNIYENNINEQKLAFFSIFYTRTSIKEKKKERKDFDYEIRTTLYPPMIKLEDIEEIGKSLDKNEKWILQQWRPTPNLWTEENKEIVPYANLNDFIDVAKKYSDYVQVKDV